ncbi:FISUMP domain-containing protein [Ekhidna sp.]|uniref:FISUMP domain-containing protein n=1 Tax=Ekhidna sp. TaxID=2608089 RepID=UPI003C7C2F0A
MKNKLFVLLLLSLFFVKCTESDDPSPDDVEELADEETPLPLEDVVIGEQTWANRDLTDTVFRNGDVILKATNALEWQSAGTAGIPAWCYQNFNDANASKGVYYNWHAVDDSRGLAPMGWRIPSREEWETLGAYIFEQHPVTPGVSFEFHPGAQALMSESGWPNEILNFDCSEPGATVEVGNGTDDYGFAAVPGPRILLDGTIYYDKLIDCDEHRAAYVSWWSSSLRSSGEYADIVSVTPLSIPSPTSRNSALGTGLKVRCIR